MQLRNNMKGSVERLNVCKNIVFRKLEKKICTNINALTFKSCTISLLKISLSFGSISISLVIYFVLALFNYY